MVYNKDFNYNMKVGTYIMIKMKKELPTASKDLPFQTNDSLGGGVFKKKLLGVHTNYLKSKDSTIGKKKV